MKINGLNYQDAPRRKLVIRAWLGVSAVLTILAAVVVLYVVLHPSDSKARNNLDMQRQRIAEKIETLQGDKSW